MFCNHCGKEIPDSVKFCPGCGQECAPRKEKLLFESYALAESPVQKPAAQKAAPEGRNRVRKRAGITLAAVAIILFCIWLGFRFGSGILEEEYSIAGEWASKDLIDFREIMESVLTDKLELSDVVAGAFLDAIGMDSDNLSELTFTFTESGSIRIGVYGYSVGVGDFTYEIVDESKMLLDFSVTVVTLPLHLSYRASYWVGEKMMKVDFFGYELTFLRKG